MHRSGPFARDLPCTHRRQYPIHNLALGADDRHDKLAALVCVPAREGDGSLTVDETGEVCSLGLPKGANLLRLHAARSLARRPPAGTGRGPMMVEAAGQPVCLFRDRLDYAFTPAEAGGGACYPKHHRLES